MLPKGFRSTNSIKTLTLQCAEVVAEHAVVQHTSPGRKNVKLVSISVITMRTDAGFEKPLESLHFKRNDNFA